MAGRTGILEQAAAMNAPRAGKVLVLAVTDAAARFLIPAELKGRFAVLTMDGAKADFALGGPTVACVYGQASGVSSEVITANAGSGGHLEPGIPRSFLFPGESTKEVTHMSVDCVGSGSGKLYIEIQA